MEDTKLIKVERYIISIIILLAVTFSFAACSNKNYEKAVGNFKSSNGSTLEIIEINDSSITYQISLVGFSPVHRTDKFDSENGRLIAYYSPNGVDIPLIYLKYDTNLDCWKNEAILPEPVLDFYRIES